VTQIQGIKLKLIGPEFKDMQAQMSAAQKVGNYKEMNESRAKLSRLQEKHGINQIVSLLGLIQIPFLITWF
jgi:membrane protein insertase Oxa1/YidC/SpoIIIJ